MKMRISEPVSKLGRNGSTTGRHLDVLTWGLVPYFTKDLKSARKPINAEAETLATSPMFTRWQPRASYSRTGLCVVN